MQNEAISIDQEDDVDTIETFGTSYLMSQWREILRNHTDSYKNWNKRARALSTKVNNLKISIQKDMMKIGQSILQTSRTLQSELNSIPCSLKEAEDFNAFAEAIVWISSFLEVSAYVPAQESYRKTIHPFRHNQKATGVLIEENWLIVTDKYSRLIDLILSRHQKFHLKLEILFLSRYFFTRWTASNRQITYLSS